jgi:hypothetical protein
MSLPAKSMFGFRFAMRSLYVLYWCRVDVSERYLLEITERFLIGDQNKNLFGII